MALCAKSPAVNDNSDPGTGKTRAHIDAFAKHRAKRGGKALVIAPKTLVESAWLEDFTKYQPDLAVGVATAENGRAGFDRNDFDVVITNTDAVKWIEDNNPKQLLKGFDTFIVDEFAAYKHRTSQRSKAMAKLARFFEFRRGLGATPNPNSVLELWHQIYLLDDGKRLGINYFKFRAAVAEAVQIGPRSEHVEWRDKPGIEGVVAHMIKDITIRHAFERCLDIPPNFTVHVPYHMPNKLTKAYKRMAEECVLELGKREITAVHAAALRTKLLQMASGAVYDGTGGYVIIDRARYELIAELVEARKHSVTFFNWKHQREELAREFDKRGISYAVIDGETPSRHRAGIVTAYQEGAYQTLLMHPETGAHGLTLTRGTATIMTSPVYRADWAKQMLHRVYRGGQTQKTETILVEAVGTVERMVYDRRADKADRMNIFLALTEMT